MALRANLRNIFLQSPGLVIKPWGKQCGPNLTLMAVHKAKSAPQKL